MNTGGGRRMGSPSRRDPALIAPICAAPAKGTPRKWPENCLKITENEVLHGSPIWDFLSRGKKACLRPIFTSRPENRDRVSNSSLECCGLVIHAARSGFFFLGYLSYQCFCGKHEIRDRGGVLQRVPGHFRRVDHACFHQVDILAGGNVVTFVP